ncbi:MAG: DNA-processing protein DprA [Patescibacteria group bacterium]
MNSIRKLTLEEYPALIRELPKPPEDLYIVGELPPANYIYLTVVGARRYSDYGKQVCEKLIEGLRGLPVVIVSGLAFGIDIIAHKAALKNNIKTIAIPGSGLRDDVITPATHINIAKRILEAGGALLSPFPPETPGANWTFPVRNEIMAGISHATLVIEAVRKSGTLITAKHATDFNRNVLTVPGSIFSNLTEGPHMLIRLGATPITSVSELIEALGFKSDIKREEINYSDLGEDEIKIMEALASPLSRDLLLEKLGMETGKVNALISLLEIKGMIEETMGELRRV